MRLTVTTLKTPLGPMVAAATDDALCLLEFEDRPTLQRQLNGVLRDFEEKTSLGRNAVVETTGRQLGEYLAGERVDFSVPVSAPGTAFQESVWAQLRRIPYGETRSYGDLARALGKRGAERAVGTANGDNRIAILLPCHRVLRADGQLGGYAGHLWRKQALLDLEATTLAETDRPSRRRVPQQLAFPGAPVR